MFDRTRANFSFCFLLDLVVIITCICSAAATITSELNIDDVAFLQTIDGIVAVEDFAYYLVDRKENMLLNLSTIEGDCDLYVRQARVAGEVPPNPSTDTNSYDLQSSTCGQDVIVIDDSIVRPFCIGIYAHPSHSVCLFRLQILGINSNELDYVDSVEHDTPQSYFDDQYFSDANAPTKDHEFAKNHKNAKDAETLNESKDFDFLELLLSIVVQFLGFLFEVIL